MLNFLQYAAGVAIIWFVLAVVELNHLLRDFSGWWQDQDFVDVRSNYVNELVTFQLANDSRLPTLLSTLDPQDAFQQIISVKDNSARALALQSLAETWSMIDPIWGLEQAKSLPASLERQFRSALGLSWARLDPHSFLGFAEIDPLAIDFSSGLSASIASAPHRVFAILDRPAFDPAFGEPVGALRLNALMAMVAQGPSDAVSTVMGLPEGEERNRMLRSIFDELALRDSQLSLSLLSLLPSSDRSDLFETLLPTLVQSSMDAAYNLAVTYGQESAFVSFVSADSDSAFFTADMLVSQNNEKADDVLAMVMSDLLDNETSAALEWLIANESFLSQEYVALIIRGLEPGNVPIMLRYYEQVPAEWRPSWQSTIAKAYAEYDLPAAVRWVDSFRGQQSFDSLYSSVLNQAIETDIDVAVRMLEGANVYAHAGSIRNLAATWAKADPGSAAVWVASLDNAEEVASSAAMSVAINWARLDFSSAEDWVGSLPKGTFRDGALEGLISLSGREGAEAGIDRIQMLDLFSTDAAKQKALEVTIDRLIDIDPQRASSLLDQVADSEARQYLEELLRVYGGTDGA